MPKTSDGELFDGNDLYSRKNPKKGSGGRGFSSKIGLRKTVGGWRLFTISSLGLLPAGGRLLKGKPWPVDRFIFEDEEEAKKNAEALAAYLGTTVEE